jgi:hypothetical protein
MLIGERHDETVEPAACKLLAQGGEAISVSRHGKAFGQADRGQVRSDERDGIDEARSCRLSPAAKRGEGSKHPSADRRHGRTLAEAMPLWKPDARCGRPIERTTSLYAVAT